jgi:LmbE family N-acetylglucosaminyl deacetylase
MNRIPRPSIRKATLIGLCLTISAPGAAAPADDDAQARPLRIIAFGAHPDDAEFQLGGTALRWARLGHKVKFVSVTNGDIGHWNMAGGPLAKRRTAEVREAARRLGIEVEVLDIHDGEILVTLENRKTIARLIRQWQADLVFCHRPDDYHPDHRNCGLLVRDAAFMVTVPFYVPDTPRIEHNTVFMYFYDRFTKPYAFQGDVAVAIDEVLDDKVHALDALESQVYEGGALGSEEFMREKAAGDPIARRKLLAELWSKRHQAVTDKYRDTVIDWYGEELGRQIKHAEIFEICEYGHQPTKDELRRLFPFYEAPQD